MSEIERLRALRRAATEARNSYVGRNWPSMRAMGRDGIGYGLVEDLKHERAIRRFISTFSPDFMVDLLDEMRRLRDVADAARPLVAVDPEADEVPDEDWGREYLTLRAALYRLGGAS